MHVRVPVVGTDVLCNRALRPKLIVPPPLLPQKKHSPASQSSLSLFTLNILVITKG